MAVKETDIENSLKILKKSGAKKVFLFGSALISPQDARDLDLAYEGIPIDNFLDTVGELIDNIDIKVDLIDLSEDTPFTRFIKKYGKVIYESK